MKLKQKYHVSDLPLKEVKLRLASDFFQYLRTKQEPCEHNSAIKYIKNVKSVFNYAFISLFHSGRVSRRPAIIILP